MLLLIASSSYREHQQLRVFLVTGHRCRLCTYLLALWWPLESVIRAFLTDLLFHLGQIGTTDVSRGARGNTDISQVKLDFGAQSARIICVTCGTQKPSSALHIRKRFIAFERLPKQKRPASNLAGRRWPGAYTPSKYVASPYLWKYLRCSYFGSQQMLMPSVR